VKVAPVSERLFCFIEEVKETAANRFFKQIELAARRFIIAALNRKKRELIRSTPLPLSDEPTILFLRQDRYGDAIISTPILVHIAKKYPKAKLMMLLGENNKDIAPLLPIRCETFIYRKKLVEDIKLLRQLRRRHIDVLVDMTDNASATSSIVTAIVDARYAIGIEKENAESYNVRVPRLDRGRYHISRRIAELLRPFGIDPETASLAPILRANGVQKIHGRIGFNISCKPERYQTPEVNAEVVRLLAAEDVSHEVLIFGQPSHAGDVKRIVTLAANEKVKAAPITRSYAEFANTLATCEYIVSPDTSVVHLGSAFSIPMVVFFSVSPPTLQHWTPVGVAYEMIVKESMQPLIPSEVLDAFRALLQKVRIREEVLA